MASVCGRGKTSFTRRGSFRDVSASPARSFCWSNGVEEFSNIHGIDQISL